MEKRIHYREKALEFLPLVSTVVVIVFFQIVTKGRLLSVNNLAVLTNQLFTVLLIAMAAVFVYAHGCMDISIGSSVGCGMLVGTLVTIYSGSILLGFLMIMVFCTGVGFTNGILSANFRELPYLPTLCMMFVLRAILAYAGNIQTFKISNEYAVYDNIYLKVIALVVCGAVSLFLYNYTKVGRFNKAMGGNQKAAEQLGVNLAKYKTIAFTLVGIYSGIAACFLMVRTRSVVAESGSGIEFDVMVSLIYGGLPLSGGSKAKFSATILGSIIMTVLGNGMIMWGMSVGMVALVKAIIFLILVAFSYTRTPGPLPR